MAYLARHPQDQASEVGSEPARGAALAKVRDPASAQVKAAALAVVRSGLREASAGQQLFRASSRSIRKKPAKPAIKERLYSRRSCGETALWISSASFEASDSGWMKTPFRRSNNGDSGRACGMAYRWMWRSTSRST